LYLVTGNLTQALTIAQQSVELADQSGEEYQRMENRTRWAYALHQSGRTLDGAAVFREAEVIEEQRRPAYPFLHSLPGFRYCDLLLDQGRWQEAKDRAAQSLEWGEKGGSLLTLSLDNLVLGCVHLLQVRSADTSNLAQAAEFLQRSVDGLRLAERQDYLPRGLLACAELHRLTGDYPRAQSDLAEAQRIAERGEMGLHLCDCHLEWARLSLAQGAPTLAREHWATAKAMVERMGYHRRDREVEEIARELGETA
jgi:tetratricopeptide (TPR) repeat protein